MMAQGRTQDGRTSNRGFASMDAERQREIASMGGKAVPDSKRSFSQNRRLAAEAGRKGGQSVPGSKRSFSQDRALGADGGSGAQRGTGQSWRRCLEPRGHGGSQDWKRRQWRVPLA